MVVQEEIAGTRVRAGLREAAVWRVVADWFGRHPHDLWLRRIRLDGEDVLRVYVVRPEYRSQHADLPLGELDVVRCYTDDWQLERAGLRQRVLGSESTAEVLDQLCSDLELACDHGTQAVPTPRVLAYRAIASILGAAALGDHRWECHSLVGPVPSRLELREDLLEGFEGLRLEPPAHAYPPMAPEEAAFGWWVLKRDDVPRIAISDRGEARLPDGRSVQLPGSPGDLAELEAIWVLTRPP